MAAGDYHSDGKQGPKTCWKFHYQDDTNFARFVI